MNYQEINAQTIDRWVEEGWEWGKPVSHEEYERALHNEWDIVLTPTKKVPHEWFLCTPEEGDDSEHPLRGKKVLGLASGGGQQMPIFAALGAECTVLDYSQKQIEAENYVAEREGYSIRAVRGDMTKPFPFEDGEFDLIFHPVSNCYIEKVEPVFAECSRVLKKGGVLLGGFDHQINYVFNNDYTEIINTLPFNPLINPEQMRQLREDDAGVQFSHTLQEQIGGQIAAGLCLTDIYEDTYADGFMGGHNIPTFFATRAIKM